MQDRFLKFEIGGIFFVLSFSVFLQNLYTLSGHNLLGIMFGSVNNSIWEITKTLLLPFVLWSMIELLSVKVPFHRFVIAKTISLYCLGVVYIALCLIISLFGLNSSYLPEFAAAIVCVAAALYLSYRLTMSSLKTDNIFMPALFMLLLFVAIFLSFTTFPPNAYIFIDRGTHCV